ncbi:unnamed protein product [Amoebophrya sp. A120]|nr:unnamed protein product [Amoebophrya sp. A120]|eukprot:GSA120T00007160001.1
MPARNYYDTLEVGRTATDFELKNSYRRLALKYHPDKDAANSEHFREIAEAFVVLSDPLKRAKFDQYGESGLKDGVLEQSEYRGWQYVGDPMTLFYEFFGETSPHAIMLNEHKGKFNLVPRTITVTPGVAPEHDLELRCTLEELYRGSTKSYKIDRQRFDREGRSYVDTKALTIKIEPGWKPGTRLRFAGEGNQLHPSEKKAADVIFTVVEDVHSVFERIPDTYDLIYIHKCTLLEALTGHVINLELLDDSVLNLHVPEIVTPGYEKRVLSHGLKLKSGKCGDLVVRWDIQFPSLSSEQKSALKGILKK